MAAAGQVAADPILHNLDWLAGNSEDVFLPLRSNDSRFVMPGTTRAVLHRCQIFCGLTRALLHGRVGIAGAELSPPDARINTDEPTEDTREVRLVMHPAVEAYL